MEHDGKLHKLQRCPRWCMQWLLEVAGTERNCWCSKQGLQLTLGARLSCPCRFLHAGLLRRQALPQHGLLLEQVWRQDRAIGCQLRQLGTCRLLLLRRLLLLLWEGELLQLLLWLVKLLLLLWREQ